MMNIENAERAVDLWRDYISSKNRITRAMGGISHIEGEFAEQLIAVYMGAEQAVAGQRGYDLLTRDGRRVQVKERGVLSATATTNLGDIHTWEFDILVVVFFDKRNGDLLLAKQFSVDVAQANAHAHGNRFVITTSARFMDQGIDITNEVRTCMEMAVFAGSIEQNAEDVDLQPAPHAVIDIPAVAEAPAGNPGHLNMSDYKAWLTNRVKASSVNNYMCGLRRILSESDMEFADFAAHITELAPSYQRGGTNEELGKVYNGAGRAAVNSLIEFVAEINRQ